MVTRLQSSGGPKSSRPSAAGQGRYSGDFSPSVRWRWTTVGLSCVKLPTSLAPYSRQCTLMYRKLHWKASCTLLKTVTKSHWLRLWPMWSRGKSCKWFFKSLEMFLNYEPSWHIPLLSGIKMVCRNTPVERYRNIRIQSHDWQIISLALKLY